MEDFMRTKEQINIRQFLGQRFKSCLYRAIQSRIRKEIIIGRCGYVDMGNPLSEICKYVEHYRKTKALHPELWERGIDISRTVLDLIQKETQKTVKEIILEDPDPYTNDGLGKFGRIEWFFKRDLDGWVAFNKEIRERLKKEMRYEKANNERQSNKVGR